MATRQQRRRNQPRPVQTQGIFPQLLTVQSVQLLDPSHALVGFGAELVFSGLPGWLFSGNPLVSVPELQMDGSYLCTFAGAIFGAAAFQTEAWDLNARGLNGAWVAPGSTAFNESNPLLEQNVIASASRSSPNFLQIAFTQSLGSLGLPVSWNVNTVGSPIGIVADGGAGILLEFAGDPNVGDILTIPAATTEVVSSLGWPCAPAFLRVT